MPKSTFDVLKDMRGEFRQNSQATGESLEAFSRRKYQDLNEPLGYEELEQALPGELRGYLILDPAKWQKREAMSAKARQIKVDTALIYEKRKERRLPDIMGRSINATAYYLEQTGQTELLAEYERMMSVEPDEERDRELRINKGIAREDVEEELKYERGHMLARLCEKYKDVKPEDLLNLTEEERLERMAELEFIYAISCNLDTVLKGKDGAEEIKFKANDYQICEHVHSLMEVTGAFALEHELMTNPCYKYLDMEALFSETDANKLGETGVALFREPSEAIGRLGMDLMNSGFRIQRLVGVRVEEELKKCGFDLTETKYTKPDGTEIDPLDMDGISYIAMGGTVLAKDRYHERKIIADMKGKLEVSEIKPEDYVLPRIRKSLSEYDMADGHITFMKEDGSVWDSEKQEDLEYFAEGNRILVNSGDRQVSVQQHNDLSKLLCAYTQHHRVIEEARVRQETEYAKRQARIQLEAVEQPQRERLDESITEAQDAIAGARTRELPEIRLMLRRSDPLLMKSSPEYKSVKRAMKAFAHMPAINRDDPDSIQRARELLDEVLQNANTYLANKYGKTTHSRTETSRMVSMRRAREFAFAHLNRLNDMVRDIADRQSCLGRIAAQEAVIREQDKRMQLAISARAAARVTGRSVPKKVQEFFEEKWKSAEQAAHPSVPEVPEEVKTYLEEQKKAEEAAKKAAEEAKKAEEARKAAEEAAAHPPVPEVPEEVKTYLEKEKKAALEKFAAFQKKVDEIAEEEILVESINIAQLDITLDEIATDRIQQSKYKDLAVLTDEDPKEQLTGELEVLGKQLLSEVLYKRVVRNDQHAHSDKPEAGVITKMTEQLNIWDNEAVIMATKAFQTMTERISRESLYDTVINLDTPAMKQQVLNIMKEMPSTAKELLAQRKISVEPQNFYEAYQVRTQAGGLKLNLEAEDAKEPAKEPAKEQAKEPAKEQAKEPAKEVAKEPAKEVAKEPAKESVKDEGKVKTDAKPAKDENVAKTDAKPAAKKAGPVKK